MAETEQSPKPMPIGSSTSSPGKYMPPNTRRIPSGTPTTPQRPAGVSPSQLSSSPLASASGKAASWRVSTSTASPAAESSPGAFPTLGSLRPTPTKMSSSLSLTNSASNQAGPSRKEIIVPARQTAARKSSYVVYHQSNINDVESKAH